MKKAIQLLFSLLLVSSFENSNAQNLVPNPGFENFLSCPVETGQLYRCQDWSSYGNSPDYFNACSPDSIVGVPDNLFGFQHAASGNAYAGFINETGGPAPPLEYLGVQLTQALIAGQKYYASFKVSFSGSVCPSTKMGIRLSNVPYDSTTVQALNNNAVVYANSVLSDTLNWYQVTGSFIADSNYSHIIIGNFFSNVASCPVLTYTGYYFLDDVCLSTDSLICNGIVGIYETQNDIAVNMFPNPFSDELNIRAGSSENLEVILYDITSRKIFSRKFSNNLILNTHQFESGVYLYEIRKDTEVVKKGLVVKN